MARDVRDRLMEKFQVDPATGCWLWTANLSNAGYGQITMWMDRKQRVLKAHRVSYETFVGPIPEGLQIDHLCRVRRCINPDHLEPVTNRENVVRGLAPATNRQRLLSQTHCPNGHSRTPENTSIRPNGHRKCLPCQRDRYRMKATEPGYLAARAAYARSRRSKVDCFEGGDW